MKAGKLNWDDLTKIIESSRSVQRDEVRIRSGVGEDCSVIAFGDQECVVSTDPITGAAENIGKLAVHINCNDIASSGVEPIGILVTILAPEGTTLEEIHKIMQEIDNETKKLNIEILGGHTEITSAVNKLIVSCTAIGKGKLGKAVATAGAMVGDDIVVTKEIALEGTAIIVSDYNEYVKEFLTEEEMQEAKTYINCISVVEEGRAAGEFGVHSMHDITEGGVLGALWEMAKASGVGFLVDKERMPVSSITERICRRMQLDPLRLISSGSMLITTSNGKGLVEIFKQRGIKGTVIGKITEENGNIVSHGEMTEVDPPERDELFTIDEKIKRNFL